MSTDELVQRFAEICAAQDKALLYSDTTEFNQLFDRMVAVAEELKHRPGDARRALVGLYDHPNAQVRLKAAKHTLAVAPEIARQLIEEIASSKKFPQAGDAGMTLVNLDRGIFKPT